MLTPEQLKLRLGHVCASESPTLCCPDHAFLSLRELYAKKTMPELDPNETTDAMEAGNYLEDGILRWGAHKLQVEISRENLWVVSDDPGDGGVCAATLDAWIVSGIPGIMEAKCVSESRADLFGEAYSDEIPDDYMVQVQQQMLCAHVDHAWLVALFAGYGFDLRPYYIPRNNRLIKQIQERAVAFKRDHLDPRIPPDGAEIPPLEFVKRVRRTHRVAYPEPQLGSDLALAIQRRKAAEAAEELAKAALAQAMADADEADCRDGGFWTYHSVKSSRLDLDRLRAEQPEIAAKYAKTSEYPIMKEAKRKEREAHGTTQRKPGRRGADSRTAENLNRLAREAKARVDRGAAGAAA